MRWYGLDWSCLEQKPVEGSCEHDKEPSGSIKFGKFLSSCTTGSFSRRTLLHEVSILRNKVACFSDMSLPMATVLEVYTTEEQISIIFSYGQKDSMRKIFIKKYFLFTVRNFCRLKRFTTAWQTFRWWRRGWNGGAEVAETTVERPLCSGFRRTGKTMGQVYQCWWRLCRDINIFFPDSNITCFTFYINLRPSCDS
jgi:hypothetical protein